MIDSWNTRQKLAAAATPKAPGQVTPLEDDGAPAPTAEERAELKRRLAAMNMPDVRI